MIIKETLPLLNFQNAMVDQLQEELIEAGFVFPQRDTLKEEKAKVEV